MTQVGLTALSVEIRTMASAPFSMQRSATLTVPNTLSEVAPSLGDLDTLVRFEIPFVGIVGNNGCWGLEKHPMQSIFGYHVAAELQPELRYDKIMETFGGWGETVSDPEEIGPAMKQALASSRPTVVDVVIDHDQGFPSGPA